MSGASYASRKEFLMYSLTKNGNRIKATTTNGLNRAQCLIRLERARAQAVTAGFTYTWRGERDVAIMSISNGDTWIMRPIKEANANKPS